MSGFSQRSCVSKVMDHIFWVLVPDCITFRGAMAIRAIRSLNRRVGVPVVKASESSKFACKIYAVSEAQNEKVNREKNTSKHPASNPKHVLLTFLARSTAVVACVAGVEVLARRARPNAGRKERASAAMLECNRV
jgi:hypothetical protein